MQLEPQNLAQLIHHPNLYFKTKRDRRSRASSAFKHVILNQPHSHAVFLVYESGSCVILGCRSQTEITDAGRWIAQSLNSRIISEPRVRNVVYVFAAEEACRWPILSRLHAHLLNKYTVSYEPELSPALMFSPQCQPNAKVMVFGSGKINVTGLRSFADIPFVVKEVIKALTPSENCDLLVNQTV